MILYKKTYVGVYLGDIRPKSYRYRIESSYNLVGFDRIVDSDRSHVIFLVCLRKNKSFKFFEIQIFWTVNNVKNPCLSESRLFARKFLMNGWMTYSKIKVKRKVMTEFMLPFL